MKTWVPGRFCQFFVIDLLKIIAYQQHYFHFRKSQTNAKSLHPTMQTMCGQYEQIISSGFVLYRSQHISSQVDRRGGTLKTAAAAAWTPLGRRCSR